MRLNTIPVDTDTEMRFWREYLTFLNGLSNRPLTDRELDVVSYYLSCSLDIPNPLRGKSRKRIKALFNIREQTLAMHIGNIKEKGWMKSEGKKYIFRNEVEKVRQQIKSTGDYSLHLSMNITYDPQRKSRQDNQGSDRKNGASGESGQKSYNGLVENHQETRLQSTGEFYNRD